MSPIAMTNSPFTNGPHQQIATTDVREQFLAQMLDALWDRYRTRVEHIDSYERVVQQAGATFQNDHIAFRTMACQWPMMGIASVSRIFEALGYQANTCYRFPDKHLAAIHFQHPNPSFPKIFISELQVWELSEKAREIIERTVAGHRHPVSIETLGALRSFDETSHGIEVDLLKTVLHQFNQLPWDPPRREDVMTINDESQYAAWVLVHGYNVNHFTCLVNSHGVESLDDIEKTVAALNKAGVPMKERIEGEPGSKLRQSATEAVVLDVAVRENGRDTTMPWTYAYLEFAERGNVVDPLSGKSVRFEGFLGPQATQLFEMTRLTNQ